MSDEICTFNGGGGGRVDDTCVFWAERSAEIRDGDMGGQDRADG